jgi:hypothetical protein
MKKVLAKFLIFALIVSAFAATTVSCAKYGPVNKELDKVNNDTTRYWKAFIKKNGIDAIDNGGESILMAAIQGNNTNLVKAILKCKADPNRYVTNASSHAPMFLASVSGNADILKMLLDKKGLPIAYDNNGNEVWNLLRNITYSLYGNVDVKQIQSQNIPELFDLVLKYVNSNSLDESGLEDSKHSSGAYFRNWFRNGGGGNSSNPYLWLTTDLENEALRLAMLEKMYKKGYKPCGLDLLHLVSWYCVTKSENSEKLLSKIINESGTYTTGKYIDYSTLEYSLFLRNGNTIYGDPDKILLMIQVLANKFNFQPRSSLAEMFYSSYLNVSRNGTDPSKFLQWTPSTLNQLAPTINSISNANVRSWDEYAAQRY